MRATIPVRFSRTMSRSSVSIIVSGLQVSYLVWAKLVMLTFALVTEESPLSTEDQLFDDVRQATKDVRSDWYSLALQLGLDYGTRKVRSICLLVCELYNLKPHPQAIESDYRFVDVCFHAVLRHWVRRTSPPLMWTALVRALKSPVINRGDIAEEIESTKVRFCTVL